MQICLLHSGPIVFGSKGRTVSKEWSYSQNSGAVKAALSCHCFWYELGRVTGCSHCWGLSAWAERLPVLGGVGLSASSSQLWWRVGSLYLFLRVTRGQGVEGIRVNASVSKTPTFFRASSGSTFTAWTNNVTALGWSEARRGIHKLSQITFPPWIKINFLYAESCSLLVVASGQIHDCPSVKITPTTDTCLLLTSFGIYFGIYILVYICWQKPEKVGTAASFYVDNLTCRLTKLSKCHRPGYQKGNSNSPLPYSKGRGFNTALHHTNG